MYFNTCSTAGGYVSEGHGTWLGKMSQQGHWPCCGLALCFLLWPPYDKQQSESSTTEPPHCDGLQPQPKKGYPSWLHQILRVTEERLILNIDIEKWQTWPCSSSISRTDWWGDGGRIWSRRLEKSKSAVKDLNEPIWWKLGRSEHWQKHGPCVLGTFWQRIWLPFALFMTWKSKGTLLQK